MRLFLASSLFFVGDIITKSLKIKKKSVGCIWNGAKEWGGKKAWRNQLDISFFEEQDCEVIDIDIEKLDNTGLKKLLTSLDIIFIGGGDEIYLAEIFKQQKMGEILKKAVEGGLIYISTSAGSMITSKYMYHIKDKKNVFGLGLVDFQIIPHRGRDSYKEYWMDQMNYIYTLKSPIILLGDRDVIVVENGTMRVETSEKYSYEDIADIVEKLS